MSEEKKQVPAQDAEQVVANAADVQPVVAEQSPESVQPEAEPTPSQEPATAPSGKQTTKKTGRLIFNVTPRTLDRFQSALDKPSEESMRHLLDALDYVRSGKPTESARQIADLKQTIARPEAENSRVKTEMQSATRQIADYEQTISRLEAEIASASQPTATPSEKPTKAETESAAKIAALEQELETLRTHHGDNQYPAGDILHFFPSITAQMLALTAERLTAARKDGIEVTPAMVLGDMFNKYTIQRFNLWFYKFVLDDKDIVAIAQGVNSRLTSIRMVRAALGIK